MATSNSWTRIESLIEFSTWRGRKRRIFLYPWWSLSLLLLWTATTTPSLSIATKESTVLGVSSPSFASKVLAGISMPSFRSTPSSPPPRCETPTSPTSATSESQTSLVLRAHSDPCQRPRLFMLVLHSFCFFPSPSLRFVFGHPPAGGSYLSRGNRSWVAARGWALGRNMSWARAKHLWLYLVAYENGQTNWFWKIQSRVG